jgi:hypothetical protein
MLYKKGDEREREEFAREAVVIKTNIPRYQRGEMIVKENGKQLIEQ